MLKNHWFSLVFSIFSKINKQLKIDTKRVNFGAILRPFLVILEALGDSWKQFFRRLEANLSQLGAILRRLGPSWRQHEPA